MNNATPDNNRGIVIKDGNYYLELAHGKGLALIDSNYSYLCKFNWSLAGDGYAVAWVDKKVTKLHHLITGKPQDKQVVDHINRDKLDNRAINLRVTDQKTNMRNTGMFSTNTSGYKGVTYDKTNHKWIAQAFYDGKQRFGGRHKTIQEAVKARKKLEIQFN